MVLSNNLKFSKLLVGLINCHKKQVKNTQYLKIFNSQQNNFENQKPAISTAQLLAKQRGGPPLTICVEKGLSIYFFMM